MRKILLATAILFCITISAQFKNPEKEVGMWYMFNGTHKVSNKFKIKTMAHFRFFDFANDLQQFISRLGGNYDFNKNYNITLGYAYLNSDGTYQLDGGNINEHRIYAAANASHKFSELGIKNRIMYEQRFFSNKTTQWVRYQLGFSYPISDKWSTYLYDEVFFDFDGESFNQNWLGAGFKYKVNNTVKLKAGYQNIGINNNLNLHRILLGIELYTK